MSTHTPGRLFTQLETFSVNPTGDCDLSFLIRTQTDLSLIGEVYGCDDTDEANARRLVACWNACEGISTDELETTGGAAVGWTRAASKLIHATTQRDELLAALKHIASHGNKMDFDAVAYARAAIAKAGGEA